MGLINTAVTEWSRVFPPIVFEVIKDESSAEISLPLDTKQIQHYFLHILRRIRVEGGDV